MGTATRRRRPSIVTEDWNAEAVQPVSRPTARHANIAKLLASDARVPINGTINVDGGLCHQHGQNLLIGAI